MTTRKKKVWNPKYCIACHEVIRPQEKQATFTTKNNVVFYFHEEHYKQLLGRPIGGRPNLSHIAILVNTVERKRARYMQDNNLNDQEMKLVGGMKQILMKMPKQIQSQITPKPTNRPPKAHVEEFEPSKDDKEYDLSEIIKCLNHYPNHYPLSSKQIEALTNIPRSTVTWRLWEHCQGNEKSKKEELFYVTQKVKGVQYYGLIDNRIKHELGTISITAKKCKLCDGILVSVAPNSQVLMCPDGHTVTLEGVEIK